MPIKFNLGPCLPTSGINISGVEVRQNLRRNSQRRPWRHTNFSDVSSQGALMAPIDRAPHITEMAGANMSVSDFIADGTPLIRARVVSILRAGPVTTVGQAATPQDSIEGNLARYRDVVMLDIQLEGGAGLQMLRAIRHAAPLAAAQVPVVANATCVRALRICLKKPKKLSTSHTR
ncbi:MAG: hypothetical protein ABIR56_07590 [Polaromonas sp.]